MSVCALVSLTPVIIRETHFGPPCLAAAIAAIAAILALRAALHPGDLIRSTVRHTVSIQAFQDATTGELTNYSRPDKDQV